MGSQSQNLRAAVFYGILDTGYVGRENLFKKCAALISAGSSLVQLRAKKESEAKRREIALELLPLFKKPNAPVFIINDSVELAAEICAIIPNAGAHIGQDDMSALEARKILGETAVLGLSTHSVSQAENANALDGVLDYFAVGPVYATMTKPGREPVGLGLVERVAAMKPALPWFAIGGVNMKTARAVKNAGAERIVAVSDVLKPADTASAVRGLVKEFLGD